MIARLNGTIIEKSAQSVIIDNSGIGYEVIVPFSTFYALPEQNDDVSLHIHTHVREDAIVLFGFNTLLEKEIFLMLKSVAGIGPKLAINILSGLGPRELLEAMAGGDAMRLQSIPGVGRKTAERIALELSEKAQALLGGDQARPAQFFAGPEKRALDDAVSALLNLGYSSKAAKGAVEKAFAQTKSVDLEPLIKEALRLLA
ncbi:MAG: Holliday junction branch migration protein RuvA [Deltaproteobacteria bacterium]|nr:Holliday junction branch migration protein RuvA [Deltaproteobacteria bacterium]MBW2136658.1 Holliday junction branch migration protein RuvA [Deltaproteobacteria bacterium]